MTKQGADNKEGQRISPGAMNALINYCKYAADDYRERAKKALTDEERAILENYATRAQEIYDGLQPTFNAPKYHKGAWELRWIDGADSEV